MFQDKENKIGLLLINVVNNRIVIHSQEIAKYIKVNLFSFNESKHLLKNHIIQNSNYSMLNSKLEKGKYRLIIESGIDKFEKIINI